MWIVSHIAPNLSISAHPRDVDRLRSWAREGITGIVDVSNDGSDHYGWTPPYRLLRELGMVRTVVPGLVDTINSKLNNVAVLAAVAAIEELDARPGKTLIHCTAGLRRAPATVYAYLRWVKRMPQTLAWDYIRNARPFAQKHQPYIDGIEQIFSR